MPRSEHPLLYSFRRCPYAMRARLALLSAGIKPELREIVLRKKPAHMLAVSANGTVPILMLPSGEVIDESLEIALWALDQNDPENLLQPGGDRDDEMKALITENDGPFKHHLDRTKYATRYPNDDPADHRKKASLFLKKLDQRLSANPYLFGQRQSLADITIAPFVRQFANIDRIWFDNQPWPHLINWLNRFLESELFNSVMKKYHPWQEGDTPIYFP